VNAPPSLHELVARARTRLRAAGIAPDEAHLDARLLAQAVLGWDATQLVIAGHESAPAQFVPAYDAVVGRRAAREPLAYITGHQEFWGLPIHVTPAVLIPRPETELIVEAALEIFPVGAAFSAADVCTGSGCVAIAIARERPGAWLIATDVSRAALDVAKDNARALGVAARVRFVASDLLSATAAPFDLLVSNPPYVPLRDREGIQPEVLEHEPEAALFAGSDGLEVVRRLIPEAADRLRAGGTLIFEIGVGQDREVSALISSRADLTLVDIRRDLQGIPRTVVARRTDD
jgi:release factor glutamine methyltransferase